MYREQIKVLDCTIRDGGLINNHSFTDEFVREAYKALSKSGIDYMEFGYRSSKELCPVQDYGAWKYCDDEKIREIIDGIESKLKISIMVDAHRVREQSFAPADESPVDMIRVATYVKDIDKAIDLAKRTKDLGYDREQILVVRGRDANFRRNLAALKTELLRSPAVAGVSVGCTPMDNQGGGWLTCLGEDGSELKFTSWKAFVDYDFLDVFGVQLLRGRPLSPDFPTDQGGAVLVNEAAVSAAGWKDPLGREISLHELKKAKVVGVVKDYHFWSLHQKIEPMVLALDPGQAESISVKIKPGGIAAVMGLVRKAYEASKALHPFEFQYEFLDDRFDRLYRNDWKFGTIFALFAGLSVFIACLGMFGLAAFTAEQKAWEISIRKVLGATAGSIAVFLSRRFLRWVVMASLIAWPVAYLLMGTWVRGFHYRAPISPGLFVLAGAAAVAFALLAVSVQTAKAARTSPAERLRGE